MTFDFHSSKEAITYGNQYRGDNETIRLMELVLCAIEAEKNDSWEKDHQLFVDLTIKAEFIRVALRIAKGESDVQED